jgi:hypothetical protein
MFEFNEGCADASDMENVAIREHCVGTLKVLLRGQERLNI